MSNQHPPGEGKLFLVPRAYHRSAQPREVECDRRLRFANSALVLLCVIFLAVVGIAAYLCLCCTWEKAEDFILIFLPISCLLMGVAFGAYFRS